MAEASYRLLVVDDEPLALNLVDRVFESESDIDVHSTTSPEQGLEFATSHEVDLVITDQRMPGMDGLQFLARIREIRPRALRIVLTAYPDISVAQKAINEGLIYRFVLKPWAPEEMKLTVRRALETKRLSDEHERLVTRLKTSYEELVRAEHMAALGRLSLSLGHELGNAVNPLLANVELLEIALGQLLSALRSSDRAAPGDVGDAALQSVSAIHSASAQLAALIRGIQSYGIRAKPAPFDINQSVLSAVQLLAHHFRDRIRLERDLRAVPMVLCRGSEMTQVVLNLFGNAVDAVKGVPDPIIQVRTWHEDRTVKLQVADNGAGIDPAIVPRLFQPFATTKASSGSGLGLSICRGIVENHGGSIEAASPGGSGARFTVALPALDPRA